MDEIRRAIRSGAFAPGDRLVERRLAESLGISHIPIREALARLADEGLVERVPRHGARVAGLSHEEIEDLSSLRTVLEEFVAERVQSRLDHDAERDLKQLVQQMCAAADRGEVELVLAYDQRFHAALWSLSGNRLLIETVGQLRGRIDAFVRAATLALPNRGLRQHADAHQVLLDAILSGDPDLARTETRNHIALATARLREVATDAPRKGVAR